MSTGKKKRKAHGRRKRHGKVQLRRMEKSSLGVTKRADMDANNIWYMVSICII